MDHRDRLFYNQLQTTILGWRLRSWDSIRSQWWAMLVAIRSCGDSQMAPPFVISIWQSTRQFAIRREPSAILRHGFASLFGENELISAPRHLRREVRSMSPADLNLSSGKIEKVNSTTLWKSKRVMFDSSVYRIRIRLRLLDHLRLIVTPGQSSVRNGDAGRSSLL